MICMYDNVCMTCIYARIVCMNCMYDLYVTMYVRMYVSTLIVVVCNIIMGI